MDKHEYTVNVWFIFPLLLLILESRYDSGNAHIWYLTESFATLIFLENSSTVITKTALLVSWNTLKVVRALMLHGWELLWIAILFDTLENILHWLHAYENNINYN